MRQLPCRRSSLDEGHMGVSKNRGTPKSSIIIGFSILNHPFWGTTIFGNTQLLYVITHANVWKLKPYNEFVLLCSSFIWRFFLTINTLCVEILHRSHVYIYIYYIYYIIYLTFISIHFLLILKASFFCFGASTGLGSTDAKSTRQATKSEWKLMDSRWDLSKVCGVCCWICTKSVLQLSFL